MKRSPLARRTPLRRGGHLRQRSTRPSARARRAAAFGPQAALCRTLPCSCGCGRGPCEPHHEPPRSCGGKDPDTLPLRRECHEERHRVGARAFWRSRGRDPAEILAALREQVTADTNKSLAPVVGARSDALAEESEGTAGITPNRDEPGPGSGVANSGAPARASFHEDIPTDTSSLPTSGRA